ncbi:MAG: BON domain-containing protein [Acidobacteriales bacterium]|nr:BON domain-containing protein [Terriglobales bacterium]
MKNNPILRSILAATLIAAPAFAQNAGKSDSATAQQGSTSSDRKVLTRGTNDVQRITREVRHELVMLPYYSVFDNLAYEVRPDGTVILHGQVVRPTLKKDSEARIRDIEGIERIENRIEVLPTSINDDRLRRALYRTIYGHSSLNKYAMGAVPPIHIIVKNGQVTLEGVVLNEMDKNIANIQANSVPGVFKVTNNLKVESD